MLKTELMPGKCLYYWFRSSSKCDNDNSTSFAKAYQPKNLGNGESVRTTCLVQRQLYSLFTCFSHLHIYTAQPSSWFNHHLIWPSGQPLNEFIFIATVQTSIVVKTTVKTNKYACLNTEGGKKTVPLMDLWVSQWARTDRGWYNSLFSISGLLHSLYTPEGVTHHLWKSSGLGICDIDHYCCPVRHFQSGLNLVARNLTHRQSRNRWLLKESLPSDISYSTF